MSKPKRPSIPKIRKAFNRHLCQDITGYEITMWDLMNWLDLDEAINFFEDTTALQMGVCQEYESFSTRDIAKEIKRMAWEGVAT